VPLLPLLTHCVGHQSLKFASAFGGNPDRRCRLAPIVSDAIDPQPTGWIALRSSLVYARRIKILRPFASEKTSDWSVKVSPS
jgi:hypothetical protein